MRITSSTFPTNEAKKDMTSPMRPTMTHTMDFGSPSLPRVMLARFSIRFSYWFRSLAAFDTENSFTVRSDTNHSSTTGISLTTTTSVEGLNGYSRRRNAI
ncbi:hypothetical protein LB505_006969 [Fusarium chuoi]|nr:hypothetical protein LB505_006969 [Fusarium chuoi]